MCTPKNVHKAVSTLGQHPEERQPRQKPHKYQSIGQPHPTTGANPFPEVTDLICRLPLPTLFYRLEAVHLEDLMRISVRFPVA